MMQQPQQTTYPPPRERQITEACTACGSDVSDPTEQGLNCAECGQWQYLCGECMPQVAEHSREAAWLCPDCRDDSAATVH